ncbi:MAG: PD-(D/E)XK nuclease family protein [Bdellovibrionota bacterium]
MRPQGSPCESTAHASVVLVLDRTLTPAGERRLKDLRVLGRGAEMPWPSPGVFSVSGLADKILVGLAQMGIGEGPLDVISNEDLVVGLWAEQKRSPGLKTFRRELREALKLAPLGLSYEEWISVVRELEETSSSGDLRLWSQRILLYLSALAFAVQRRKALTRWDNVARLVHGVEDAALEKLPWAALLERNPFRTEKIRFTVPEVQDPQPLEELLLKKLPLEVVRLREECNDEFPLFDLASLPPSDFASGEELAFAWAFEAAPPGPVEAVTALPGKFPIDVATKTWEDDNEELRILALFCASLAHPQSSHDSFQRFAAHQEFLKAWKLDATATPATLVQTWRSERDPPLDARLLDTIASFSLSEVSEVFGYLSESPLFRVEREAFTDSRLDPRGAPLVTLVDLPFMGANHFALWGIPKDFDKHLAPTSVSVLRSQDFPSSLRKILEGRGHWMPDPEREQRALLGALSSLGDALYTIETHSNQRLDIAPAPEWRLPQLAARNVFSPSALEAYAECSMRFYLERVLKPSRVEDWDPVPMDPLNAGNWVHAVLEDFLKAPRWNQVSEVLASLLNAKRPEIFSAPHSASYERILDQESRLLTERLEEHVLLFEKPLLEIMGERVRIDTETPLKTAFRDRSYNGKIDRLDLYIGNMALLWDYKTGSISQKKSLSQIENHKFQWHLYRAMLSQLDPGLKVAGGGYLNPLDPSKSRLVVFETLFPSEALEPFTRLCASLGHPLEIIADENVVMDALANAVEALRVRLSMGEVRPDGDIKKACARCHSRGLCGKPYFEGTFDGLA